MATRTAKRQGTKSHNNKKDSRNIHHKIKIKVGRNPKRLPTELKRQVNAARKQGHDSASFMFEHLYQIHNLPVPAPNHQSSQYEIINDGE